MAAQFRQRSFEHVYSSVTSLRAMEPFDPRLYDVGLELKPRDPRPSDKTYRLNLVAWGFSIDFRAHPVIDSPREFASRVFLEPWPRSIDLSVELVTTPTASVEPA